MNRTRVTSFKLDDMQAEVLDALTIVTGESQSDLIRTAILSHITKGTETDPDITDKMQELIQQKLDKRARRIAQVLGEDL